MENVVFGSIWWKCDFHNHTPASNDYGRNKAEKDAMTPREWLLGYMRAGIDCVAITDHNTGTWIDPLKKELATLEEEGHAEFRKIVLFPGVEISVATGIHVLALFDPSKQASDIFTLLGAVRFPASSQGSSDSVTSTSLEEVLNIIVESGGIAIPAHVDQRSGMFYVLNNNITADQVLSLNKLLAVEVVDDAYVMPDVYRKKGLALANIVGSDSHSPDKVGSVYTWIKMRVPNLDALKLALHDGKDGVIRWKSTDTDPNSVEERFFIHSLRVTNGMKAGNGTQLSVNFSPWMTSIIGGRGSGKSSLFNYLRLPFNKTDDMPESIKPEFDRFAREGSKGVEGMLRNNTLIEVEFYKDHRHLKLEFNAQTQKRRLLERNAEGHWEISIDSLDPSKHFPINIFSQKHLYELAKNPNHILKMIDARFDKSAWESELSKFEATWMDKRRRERELEKDIKNEPDLKEELNAINSRLTSYESTEKELLTEFKEFNTTNSVLLSNIDTFNSLLELLNPIVQAAKSFDIISPDVVSASTELVALADVDKKIKQEVLSLEKIYDNLEGIKGSITAALNSTPWYAGYTEVHQKYQKLLTDLESSGLAADINYDELLREKQQLDVQMATVSSKKKELISIKSSQITLRQEIYAHHRLLRTKRRESIAGWDSLDTKRTIAIYLEEMRDYTDAENSFRSLIGKSGNEFENEILLRNDEEVISGLLYDIINMKEIDDRWVMLEKRIGEFVESSESSTYSYGVRLIRHKEKHKVQAPEMLDRLLIWAPNDRVVLKLVRDGHEEDIDTGSAGQKTAGMLSLLLTADDSPLLIDQPEDDLDTRLISELLVANFKVLKKKRQIIVVTHNPNIAVNGSSEKIVQMEFKNGQIVKLESGALQDKGVRGAVCEIMEGGKAALDKRYYRISQALESV